MSTAAFSSRCQEGEIPIGAIGRCGVCTEVCHTGVADDDCPPKCKEYLYSKFKTIIRNLMQELNATQELLKASRQEENRGLIQDATNPVDTSWLFNNWGYIFIAMTIVGIGIGACISWKKRNKIIKLIKGYQNIPRQDPIHSVGMGQRDMAVRLQIDQMGPEPAGSESAVMPDEKERGPTATVINTDRGAERNPRTSEETGYHTTQDQSESGTDVKQPVLSTSEGKTTEEVDDDDQSMIALSNPGPSSGTKDLEEITNEDAPKVAYSDGGLAQLDAPRGEEERLLETRDDGVDDFKYN